MNDPETECIVMIGEIGGQLKLMLLIGLKRMETVSQL
jgi:succinyl-CoA synthetase alpha subunit